MSFDRRLSLIMTRNWTKFPWWHLIFFLLIGILYLGSYAIARNEMKAKEITVQATVLSKHFYDAGLAIGAYGLTKNQMFADRYIRLAGQIPQAVNDLDKLTVGQPAAERVRFQIIKQITGEGLAKLNQSKLNIDSSTLSPLMDDQGQARKAYKEIKALADQLQVELDGLVAEEKNSFDSLHLVQKLAHYMLLLLVFVYAISNFVVQQCLFKLLKHHSIPLDAYKSL